jgi:hypothetical protein
MAKRKQSPDWDLTNEFDDLEDTKRVNARAPQYKFRAKTIPLSTFGFENPVLASNAENPEEMMIAQELSAELEALILKDSDMPNTGLAESDTPPSPYEHIAAQFEGLPSFMGIAPRGLDVLHR